MPQISHTILSQRSQSQFVFHRQEEHTNRDPTRGHQESAPPHFFSKHQKFTSKSHQGHITLHPNPSLQAYDPLEDKTLLVPFQRAILLSLVHIDSCIPYLPLY